MFTHYTEKLGAGKLGGFLDFAVADAGCAAANALAGAIDDCTDSLQVHIPSPFGDVVRVADLISELRTFAANFTNSCHWVETPGDLKRRAENQARTQTSV